MTKRKRFDPAAPRHYQFCITRSTTDDVEWKQIQCSYNFVKCKAANFILDHPDVDLVMIFENQVDRSNPDRAHLISDVCRPELATDEHRVFKSPFGVVSQSSVKPLSNEDLRYSA